MKELLFRNNEGGAYRGPSSANDPFAKVSGWVCGLNRFDHLLSDCAVSERGSNNKICSSVDSYPHPERPKNDGPNRPTRF